MMLITKRNDAFFLITVLFLSTGGEMKRIGTYDMKRKVIVVDKSQTAQWEGTAQMSSRLWFRFLLKKKLLSKCQQYNLLL